MRVTEGQRSKLAALDAAIANCRVRSERAILSAMHQSSVIEPDEELALLLTHLEAAIAGERMPLVPEDIPRWIYALKTVLPAPLYDSNGRISGEEPASQPTTDDPEYKGSLHWVEMGLT